MTNDSRENLRKLAVVVSIYAAWWLVGSFDVSVGFPVSVFVALLILLPAAIGTLVYVLRTAWQSRFQARRSISGACLLLACTIPPAVFLARKLF